MESSIHLAIRQCVLDLLTKSQPLNLQSMCERLLPCVCVCLHNMSIVDVCDKTMGFLVWFSCHGHRSKRVYMGFLLWLQEYQNVWNMLGGLTWVSFYGYRSLENVWNVLGGLTWVSPYGYRSTKPCGTCWEG